MFITNVTNLNTRSGKEIVITAVDKENSDRVGISNNPKDVVVVALMIIKLVEMEESASVLTDVNGW